MAAATLAPGISRKLKKVLETRTDSPELLASLATLSTFYGENTLHARRGLRTTIERRGLTINEEFLQASEAAQKALDTVEAEVEGLAACCNRIATALQGCSSQTGDMVVATERLKQELESSLRRQELVNNFLQSYQLTPDEVVALREEDLDENFFKALARVQEIHANCKILLRTHHQRAGLELMDVMAVYQEGAYERLCRWVQAECRSLGENDTPEVSSLLKTAARSLRDRPVLFKYCAEEVANTRHNALFRRFLSALSQGGRGGMPKPIEMHAHDPLRYCGDMLAWLHQALASEFELASALFSDDRMGTAEQREARSASKRFSEQSDDVDGDFRVEAADMASVLDRIFEGVCRPFKLRVEQVLQGQLTPVLAYKLMNLLDFYSGTISELLGSEAALSRTLQGVCEAAQKTFMDLMKQRGDKLVRYPPPLSADLSPPPAVAEGVSLLLELIEVYDTSMAPANIPKPDFEPIIAAVVDPLLQMCERAAEAFGTKSAIPASMRRMSSESFGRRTSGVLSLQRRGSTSMDGFIRRKSGEAAARGDDASPEAVQAIRQMYLVNCLYSIQQPLAEHAVARRWVPQLEDTITEHINNLARQEVKSILDSCGLSEKLTYIFEQESLAESGDTGEAPQALSSLESMSPSAVGESLRAFYALVAGSTDSGLPEFEQIQPPRLRSKASGEVTKALAEAYEAIHKVVSDPKNGYTDLGNLLRHSPAQMKTILGTD